MSVGVQPVFWLYNEPLMALLPSYWQSEALFMDMGGLPFSMMTLTFWKTSMVTAYGEYDLGRAALEPLGRWTLD
jgi:hypothetical protein